MTLKGMRRPGPSWTNKGQGRLGCALLALLSLVYGVDASAGSKISGNAFSYIYAPVLGTGYYHAGDDNIVVLRVPGAFNVTDDKQARVQQRFLLTGTLGLSSLHVDPTSGGAVKQDLRTYSLLPGWGWKIDMRPDWQLKPEVRLGLAYDGARKETATLATAGLRSIKTWPWRDGTLTLGNGVEFAGQDVHGRAGRQGFVLFENGLDYAHPLGTRVMDTPLTLSTFVLWRHFANDLQLVGVQGEQVSFTDLFSLGVTFGFAKTVEWHHLPLHRIGLALVKGDNLEAVNITLGFPF